jgi:DNA-binding FadR family transcriptional regulator
MRRDSDDVAETTSRAGADADPPPGASADRGAIPITTGNAITRELKMSEMVARDVVQLIVSQGLRTGDRLPSEAAMLEQYGVSRESLREGLRLLEVQGLISIRRGPGGGPIIGVVDPANAGRMSTLYLHLAGGTYAELFDAWVTAEGVLAERAARNDDRDAVVQAMTPFLNPDVDDPGPAGSSVEDFVDAHLRFHAAVAALAANRVLELLMQSVGQIVTHHIVVTADPREVRSVIERDHCDIAQAVAAGDAPRARTAMEEHVRALSDYYSAQVGNRMDDMIDWR